MSAQLSDWFSKRDLTGLRKRGVETVADLLRFFPRRFLVPGEKTPFGDLVLGQTTIIQAEVKKVETRVIEKGRRFQKGARPPTLTTVLINDGAQSMRISFFNQSWLQKQLTEGLVVVFAGTVDDYRGHLTLKNPVWLNRDEHDTTWTPEELNSPFPVYPKVKHIAQSRLWKAIKVILDVADPEEFLDPLPDGLRRDLGLPDLRTALNDMHRPRSEAAMEQAKARWKWEEALALQFELVSRKVDYASITATPLLTFGAKSLRFDKDLPFQLTEAQETVGKEIRADLRKDRAMHRLLHGDVGSGKTVVALRAMLMAVDSGTQTAMLAPTEVLATQHYRSIARLLGEQMALSPLLAAEDQVRVALLTGSMPARERRQVALDLATGQIDIVVGTHALLSATTMFDDLGLIVVDEQHRFGVEQREALRGKGGTTVPHTLVMSATPIPRTVAMTVFADLDVSTLNQMPAGRKDITTHAVALGDHPGWLGRVHELVAENAAAGNGTFVVGPRIDSIEVEDPDTEIITRQIGIEEISRKMQADELLEDLRFGIIHGRQKAAEKDREMDRFISGDTDVLVATTVIEVGVDVPRATMIVIHEADRFGVAQLHQLRGRVGRDGSAAMCFLLSYGSADAPGFERLRAVASTLDGFDLADFDLEFRGEGDVLGASQWGGSSLTHLSVLSDVDIIVKAREYAERIVEFDRGLEKLPGLRRFIDRILPADDAHFIEAS